MIKILGVSLPRVGLLITSILQLPLLCRIGALLFVLQIITPSS
jgi:hypothetical protein